jgi:two-component system, LytTR family, response regulator LytT
VNSELNHLISNDLYRNLYKKTGAKIKRFNSEFTLFNLNILTMKKASIHPSANKRVTPLTANPSLEQEKKAQISFSIRQEDRTYFVLVDTIALMYLADETVCLIDFKGEKHCLSKTLDALEQAVSTQQFYRINRQMIVNRQAIKDVESYPNQRIVVHLTVPTSEIVIVPRLKVKPFLSWMEKG